MENPFFIMLYHPSPEVGYLPMTDENDEMARFATMDEASTAAMNSYLGAAFGFEVFCIHDPL